MKTRIYVPSPAGLAASTAILRRGGLVGFPTETVYGLGADARKDSAVRRIFEAKGRPASNPLIIHFASRSEAESYVEFDELASRLAEAFWPGPLTLVLPGLAKREISQLAASGHTTLGVRVPSHPVAHALLKEFGGPVAAPSANCSGKISPTSANHVLAELDGRIEAVLDGGACPLGLESTIVATREQTAILLRPGVVTKEMIAKISESLFNSQSADGRPASPGQLPVHYAPETPIRLESGPASDNELLLGFGPEARSAYLNLSPTGDLAEAAANFYAMLRQIDQSARSTGRTKIAVSPIPETGLGAAINDRLIRAAHGTR